MPQLVSMLAGEVGKSRKQAETYLKAFFYILSEALENHDNVKIKDFGTFKVNRVEARKSVNVSTGEEVRIPSHFKAVFSPSSSMAEKVNREFEWLEIMELSENISNEELETLDSEKNMSTTPTGLSIVAPSSINKKEEEESEHLGEELEKDFGELEPSEPFGPIDPDDPDLNDPIPENAYSKDIVVSSDSESLNEKEPVIPIVEVPTTVKSPNEEEGIKQDFVSREELKNLATKSQIKILVSGLIITAALLIGGFFLMYFLLLNKFTTTEDSQRLPGRSTYNQAEGEAEGVEGKESLTIFTPAEEIEEAPTKPSDTLATDQITSTRYLTTMAREYYGNFNLWPYIYIENESILGHPDRIKPGTSIVIPNLDKYGVDPENPADIEKAKKLAIEIYNRYSK